MADDAGGAPRDPRDPRDPEVAAWLAVEPLDEVTRRRLVAAALRESPPAAHPRPASRAWRWVAAAAAVVVLAVGTLAVVTAEGGNDEQTASRPPTSESSALAPTPGVPGAVPAAVGDLGDLGVDANLDPLRNAADATGAPETPGAERSQQSTDARAESRSASGCAGALPTGVVLAEGTGTLAGRAAAVVLLQRPDGAREIDAVLSDPCEVRRLS